LEDVVAKKLGETPKALQDKPEAYMDMEDFVNAFFTLSRSRTYSGNGFSPITINEMIAYATTFGFEDKQEFIWYIQAADDEFMQYQLERMKQRG